MFKRVIFIFNPLSGSSFRIIKDLEIIKNIFTNRYPHIAYQECSLLTHELSNLIEVYKDETCLFVACGGDGTVASVAEKILGNSNYYLSVLPYGTGNDFSRAIGIFKISNNMDKLVEIMVGEKVMAIDFDLWGIDNKIFLNYLSIGFDAAVVARFQKMRGKLPAMWKRPFGNRVLYLISGFFHLFYGIPSGAVIKYRNQSADIAGVKSVLLGNINSYAGGKPLASSVAFADKQLNVFKINRIWGMVRLISGRGCGAQDEKSDAIVLSLENDVMGQIDGEPYPFVKGEHVIKHVGQIKVIGG